LLRSPCHVEVALLLLLFLWLACRSGCELSVPTRELSMRVLEGLQIGFCLRQGGKPRLQLSSCCIEYLLLLSNLLLGTSHPFGAPADRLLDTRHSAPDSVWVGDRVRQFLNGRLRVIILHLGVFPQLVLLVLRENVMPHRSLGSFEYRIPLHMRDVPHRENRRGLCQLTARVCLQGTLRLWPL
jgi:hypothetical protein